MLVGELVEQMVVDAVRTAAGVEISGAEALVRPSARGGDYQSNVAMGLAKRLGRPSREIADAVVSALDPAEVLEPPTVGGPGFVNLRLRDDWLGARLTALVDDDRLGVPSAPQPQRVVVDYSGPNVAKEMHVGHLRSTIIGDAIVRMKQFLGHDVIRRNHLGDWGTPFGMLVERLVEVGRIDGEDLNAFYRAARAAFDADPEFADRARKRVVALQSGDRGTLAHWRKLVAESQEHFERVYRTLGVQLTAADSYGESFYDPFLADTLDELGPLLQESDGALCAFRDGEAAPLIVRKSDGGYTYGTTDLAALRYWTRDRDATEIIYVIGAPQRQHVLTVFSTAAAAGWLDARHRAEFVPFGSVLGADGRILRTRTGDSIRLVDLLDEAVERAAGVIGERPDLDVGAVAEAVGIGAVKYADLSSSREKDYVFTWDRMLATDGNTSVYLQYANARIRSLLRKADGVTSEIVVREPAERALAIALLRLPAAIEAADRSHSPHVLCGHLYELAAAFSRFYEACPILGDPSRLGLARLTSRALVLGLGLLGIEAPERM